MAIVGQDGESKLAGVFRRSPGDGQPQQLATCFHLPQDEIAKLAAGKRPAPVG